MIYLALSVVALVGMLFLPAPPEVDTPLIPVKLAEYLLYGVFLCASAFIVYQLVSI